MRRATWMIWFAIVVGCATVVAGCSGGSTAPAPTPTAIGSASASPSPAPGQTTVAAGATVALGSANGVAASLTLPAGASPAAITASVSASAPPQLPNIAAAGLTAPTAYITVSSASGLPASATISIPQGQIPAGDVLYVAEIPASAIGSQSVRRVADSTASPTIIQTVYAVNGTYYFTLVGTANSGLVAIAVQATTAPSAPPPTGCEAISIFGLLCPGSVSVSNGMYTEPVTLTLIDSATNVLLLGDPGCTLTLNGTSSVAGGDVQYNGTISVPSNVVPIDCETEYSFRINGTLFGAALSIDITSITAQPSPSPSPSPSPTPTPTSAATPQATQTDANLAGGLNYPSVASVETNSNDVSIFFNGSFSAVAAVGTQNFSPSTLSVPSGQTALLFLTWTFSGSGTSSGTGGNGASADFCFVSSLVPNGAAYTATYTDNGSALGSSGTIDNTPSTTDGNCQSGFTHLAFNTFSLTVQNGDQLGLVISHM